MTTTPSTNQIDGKSNEFVAVPDTMARVAHEFAEAIRSEGNIRVVFGTPLTLDKHKIIPVARVEIGFGGALGLGGNGIGARLGTFAKILGRGVSAGGGGIKVIPLGFIHEDESGVRFQTISGNEHEPSKKHRM